MMRDVKVLQAALENLQRRGSLPPSKLSLVHAETYVGALQLPAEQVLEWAMANRGFSIRHLTALIMSVGVGAASLKKKEQQEIVSALQDLCMQPYE